MVLSYYDQKQRNLYTYFIMDSIVQGRKLIERRRQKLEELLSILELTPKHKTLSLHGLEAHLNREREREKRGEKEM